MVYREYKYLDGAMFEEFVLSGANRLEKNIQKINDLNVFPIPDGDTGDNMYLTIKGGIDKMREVSDNSVCKKANALAEGMLFNARGNSGVILSQIFSGIASGFNGLEVASLSDIVNAFKEGVKKAYSSVDPPVEGTILTVARESIEKMDRSPHSQTIGDFCDEILSYMYKSLENTPELLHILKEAGVIDSGGAGLYFICEGARDAVNGEAVDGTSSQVASQKAVDYSLFTEDSELVYGYCTEFLLRLMSKKTDVEGFDEKIIIDYLKNIGDSIVCFKDGSIIKVHVHTMTPSKVLEFAQQFGEFLTVKIENMTLQHSSQEKKDELPQVKRARKKYSSVVVSDGSGFKELFTELGVDYIIDGGQGKNPSINDFVKAFDEVNSDNIFVFPNNSNIILAANQAKEVYKDSNIYVIETKNVGEAYSALSMLDYSYETPDEVYDLFVSSISSNVTALVCKATRDVCLNGVSVTLGDYISMIGKKLVSSSKTLSETIVSLLNSLDEVNLVTLFFGNMVSDSDKETLKEDIMKAYPDIELYDSYGGQDTFDLIIIIE